MVVFLRNWKYQNHHTDPTFKKKMTTVSDETLTTRITSIFKSNDGFEISLKDLRGLIEKQLKLEPGTLDIEKKRICVLAIKFLKHGIALDEHDPDDDMLTWIRKQRVDKLKYR